MSADQYVDTTGYGVPGFPRITRDPEQMSGRACIRHLRMPVITIVKLLLWGSTAEEVLHDYPVLEIDDLRQALRFEQVAAESRARTLKEAADSL